MNCDLCKKEIEPHRKPDGTIYWTDGHNAWPLKMYGRCCDSCNETKVLPERMKRYKAAVKNG